MNYCSAQQIQVNVGVITTQFRVSTCLFEFKEKMCALLIHAEVNYLDDSEPNLLIN